MNLIFEPMDLQAASPATVSRCGMVYMEPKSMGWRVLLDSWINTLPEHFTADIKQFIFSLIDWTVDHLLDFMRLNVDEISPTQDQNLVLSLFKIYKSLLKDLAKKEFYDTYTDAKIMYSILEGKFVFSLIWSFGASADTLNRKKIEAEIKQVLSGNAKIDNYDKKKVSYPERNTLFDYNFAPKKSVAPGSSFEWVLWTDYIDVNEKISKNIIPQEIIVKTNDSVRYSQVLKIFIEN
jgi:dynein heavy chain